MDINQDIVLNAIIIFIACLRSGYEMDYQLNYPHNNKHLISFTPIARIFLAFKYKKESQTCLKAAFILELIGYIILIISCVIYLLFNVINYHPNKKLVLAIVGSTYCFILFYVIIIGVYYKIKYK